MYTKRKKEKKLILFHFKSKSLNISNALVIFETDFEEIVFARGYGKWSVLAIQFCFYRN